MNTLEKVELTDQVRYIEPFSKSELLIYDSEVPDTVGIKTRRRRRKRTQAIAKHYAFYANVII